MKVKSESEVAQSCLTLCDPMDCSPPGSSIHGIFQARVLEWGAIAFSDRNHRKSQINDDDDDDDGICTCNDLDAPNEIEKESINGKDSLGHMNKKQNHKHNYK